MEASYSRVQYVSLEARDLLGHSPGNKYLLEEAVCQISNPCIVSISQDALFIVHQHAAHERTVDEQLQGEKKAARSGTYVA